MAPDGQFSARVATSSGVARSGWIHSPSTLGTNTSGGLKTQLRECTHLRVSKWIVALGPRTVSVLSVIPSTPYRSPCGLSRAGANGAMLVGTSAEGGA